MDCIAKKLKAKVDGLRKLSYVFSSCSLARAERGSLEPCVFDSPQQDRITTCVWVTCYLKAQNTFCRLILAFNYYLFLSLNYDCRCFIVRLLKIADDDGNCHQ